MSKPLRLEMPTVTGWIDELRSAFGAETINAAIKAGMAGQPVFYASENGRQIGTAPRYDENNAVLLSECHIGPMNAPAAQNANRKGNR